MKRTKKHCNDLKYRYKLFYDISRYMFCFFMKIPEFKQNALISYFEVLSITLPTYANWNIHKLYNFNINKIVTFDILIF